MNVLLGLGLLCAVLLIAIRAVEVNAVENDKSESEYTIIKRILYVMLFALGCMFVVSVARADHTDFYEGMTKYDQATIDIYRAHMESKSVPKKVILENGLEYMTQSRECAAFWAASVPFMESAAEQGAVQPDIVDFVKHTQMLTSVHVTLYARALETFVGSNMFNGDSFLHVSETLGDQEVQQYINQLLGPNREQFTQAKGSFCQTLYNNQMMISGQSAMIVDSGRTVDEFLLELKGQNL